MGEGSDGRDSRDKMNADGKGKREIQSKETVREILATGCGVTTPRTRFAALEQQKALICTQSRQINASNPGWNSRERKLFNLINSSDAESEL